MSEADGGHENHYAKKTFKNLWMNLLNLSYKKKHRCRVDMKDMLIWTEYYKEAKTL